MDRILIHKPYLLSLRQRIAHKLPGIQILFVHIDGANLMIVISSIIINSLFCVTTRSVEGNFVFVRLGLAAAPLLLHGIKNMKELVDALLLAFTRQRI